MDLRTEIIETCRKMNQQGLNQGSSGNVSVRTGDGFLITPTGLSYETMVPEDIVAMGFDGNVQGQGKPSGEWRIHRDILIQHGHVDAVIHSHALFCTTLSIHRLSIPAIHYLILLLGGDDIPCAPYAPPISPELSAKVVPMLRDRGACLMANHGVVVTGTTLSQTFSLLVEVENLASQYWHALQIGPPPVLSHQEMDEAREFMKDYGS